MRYVRALFVAQGSVLLVFGLLSGTANAALTGSGAHLLIPTTNLGAPANQSRATAGPGAGPWTGTWSSPAAAAWIGSFSVTGPIPAGVSNPTGISFYDFTSLPNGFLPTGTFFRFGDVDGGSSTNETYTLQAFDTTGAIISPWLDEAIGVAGAGTGTAGAILANDMPGWVFNPTTGTYFVDGTTITGGNPSISIYLPSNTAISFLEVTRTSAFANFSLHAPLAVPAPGGAAMLVMCGFVSVARRRRRLS